MIISIIGCLIMAFAVNVAFIPIQLFSVAFPGLGVLAHYTFGVSVGLVVFLLNVPLFLMAWKHIGRSFVFKTIIVAGIFSLFLDLLSPLRNIVQPSLWFGIVIGGILLGFGTGLIFRQELTSGGVGLLARLIQLRFPQIKMGTVHIVFDFFVLFLGAILMDMMTAIYTFIASLIMGRMIDITKNLPNPFKRYIDRRDKLNQPL
ncbi:YitT family protein [Bacillus sp. FJAT-50079]|uniref:YitT family protein n=1 Tax=Bacillus sp. FJAT-50079 TaxID=2833577 RepID=UPI002015F205|nr:YitT family protein [Bacillus sp. FJAT-50079]